MIYGPTVPLYHAVRLKGEIMKNIYYEAGQHVALSLLSISGGEVLIPIFCALDANNKVHVTRMIYEDFKEVEKEAIVKLNNNPENHQGQVFINDAIITIDGNKTDALMIDIRNHNQNKRILISIPYQNANNNGFLFYRPKIFELENISEEELPIIMDAYYDGLEASELGKKMGLWDYFTNESFDNSPPSHGEEIEITLTKAEEITLLNAPMLIFYTVAGADGEIDKKELNKFIEILSQADKYNSGLMQQILGTVISRLPDLMSEYADNPPDFTTEMKKINTIANKVLPESEAMLFKQSLLSIGADIAKSSGGIFGNKIDKSEEEVLLVMAAIFGLVKV